MTDDRSTLTFGGAVCSLSFFWRAARSLYSYQLWVWHWVWERDWTVCSELWTMHRRIVSFCRFYSPTFTSRSCARLPTHLQIVATERHFEQSAFFHKNYTANPLLFARPVIIGCRTMATSSPPEHKERRRNRLANEKSPYLLQHASNPVDWWGSMQIICRS